MVEEKKKVERVESIAELKRICHNHPRFTDRPWWYRLSRATSIRLTRMILLTGVRVDPNWVTVLAALMGISGALILLANNFYIKLIGFFLLFSAFPVDGVDGELARYYKKFSLAGSYIDKVGHAVLDPLLYIVLSISVFLEHFNFLIILMGFLTSSLISFIKTNVQLNNYIFVTELMLTPRIFLEKEKNEGVSPKDSNNILKKIIWIVNIIKCSIATVFFFLVAFTLDHLKEKVYFIPNYEYKLILLIFYCVFLSLVAINQVIFNIKNIEKEKIKQFKGVMKSIQQEKESMKN